MAVSLTSFIIQHVEAIAVRSCGDDYDNYDYSDDGDSDYDGDNDDYSDHGDNDDLMMIMVAMMMMMMTRMMMIVVAMMMMMMVMHVPVTELSL